MNIFKKIYCRTYQGIFKILLPLLPYREPHLLYSNNDVADTLIKHNIEKVLLVTDGGIAKLGLTKDLQKTLEDKNISVYTYSETVPNPTSKNVEDAVELYKQNNCQGIIAFGGGSPMDCAKATGARVANPNKTLNKMKGLLKVNRKLPLLVAVPTTAGTGSETTLAAVITDSETRHKYVMNDFDLIPRYALLDENLTVGLPPHITSTTGMDALTHALEAYIGKSTTKTTRSNSLDAIKLIFENLETAYNNGKNIEARKNMLKASYLAGLAFTKSYVGYVHAIAHSLGGKYNLAHGLANAVILPYVLKQYGKKIYRKLWQIGVYAGLFEKTTNIEAGAKLVIQKIEDMNKNMNIPKHLDVIDVNDIDEMSKTADKEANPLYPVPVLYNAKQLAKLYYQIKGE